MFVLIHRLQWWSDDRMRRYVGATRQPHLAGAQAAARRPKECIWTVVQMMNLGEAEIIGLVGPDVLNEGGRWQGVA